MMFSELSLPSAWFDLQDAIDEHGTPVCAQTDPEIWFPEKGEATHRAKKLCRTCPLQKQCLEYALETNEMFGVWGGLTVKERLRLKRLS